MDMCYVFRVTVVLVLVLTLLILIAGVVQGDEVGQGSNKMLSPADDARGTEDAALICLPLVGGTALLAGGVWMGALRRIAALPSSQRATVVE
jgi:hypothetical protein